MRERDSRGRADDRRDRGAIERRCTFGIGTPEVPKLLAKRMSHLGHFISYYGVYGTLQATA
jgi:hypothetical protein